MEPTEFDFIPQVYFRIAKPIKEGGKLPMVDLTKVFYADPEFKIEAASTTSKFNFNNK